ncbi:uncharacterized protein [Nicotiana tomentosiformis]|uniref:uncharacterized protein n=1 Tax=Nicotiana tomentosiformis TaxID=4098 RepID=UPI00388C5943
MAKTSKSIPQKETPSSSKPSKIVSLAATEEPTPEPPLKSFVPSGCPTRADFKIENTLLVPGLPKDAEMRPPSADDDIYVDPSAPKKDKEKKRRKASSSSSPKKKRPRKRLAHKHKNASARELSSDSLQRLKDESEKEEKDSELVARASVLHHEVFLRYREEFKHHEGETRELDEKKDAYKLLNTLANDSNPQVQKRLDQIEQLQVEVDMVKAGAEEWKKNMDRLTSKKEIARAQLGSAEILLRAINDKYSVQANKIKELHSQLNSVVSGQEALAKELEAAKLEVVVTKTEADDKEA